MKLMRREDLTGLLHNLELTGPLEEVDRLILAEVPDTLGDFLGTRLGTGKKLRPALLIAGAGGQKSPRIIIAAAAVELIHQASKLHDHILDERPKRPAKYLLGGDILMSSAFSLAADCGGWAVKGLAQAIEDMIEGEARQSGLAGADPSSPLYIEVCRLKTASLFAAAAAIGGRLSGADERTIRQLKRFGSEFGIAFQIIDDISDGEFKQPELTAAKAQARARLKSASAISGLGSRREPLAAIAGQYSAGISA